MSAARMVLMGVVGAGAGAFLALSTVPSFAPYRDRADSRPYSDEAEGGHAYAEAHALRQQGDPEPEQGLAVRLGPDRGTLVLDLPAWAGETVEWMGFGRRVWDDWRQFSGRFEDTVQGYLPEDRRPDRARSQPGYAEPYREREGRSYGSAERYGDEASGPALTDGPAPRSAPEPDAADLAARYAEEAVRDVLAAQAQ